MAREVAVAGVDHGEKRWGSPAAGPVEVGWPGRVWCGTSRAAGIRPRCPVHPMPETRASLQVEACDSMSARQKQLPGGPDAAARAPDVGHAIAAQKRARQDCQNSLIRTCLLRIAFQNGLPACGLRRPACGTERSSRLTASGALDSRGRICPRFSSGTTNALTRAARPFDFFFREMATP